MPDLPRKDKHLPPLVGVVPMAGRASRLAGLPCSKEIFPVGLAGAPQKRPVAVCEHLIGQMRDAGIRQVYVVIREGKWDIPAFLGDGSGLGLDLAYLMMGRPFGTPYSIDQAWAFVRDKRVALGFPDMYFREADIFAPLLDHQAATGADVVLGVFPADRPDKSDMLALDGDHRVRELVIKPATTRLRQTWGVALWTPAFTAFMHDFLAGHQAVAGQSPELFVGDVVRAAMEAGLDVQGIPVSTQPFIDIGTWDDLERVPGRP